MRICVQSYSGPRGEIYPCAFHLGGRRLPIVDILNRWSEAAFYYLEVRVADGRRFVLRYEPSQRCWELSAVYAGTRAPLAKPAVARTSKLPVVESFTAPIKEKEV